MYNVLHVITSLEPAGAETLLLNFVSKFNDPEYKNFIVYILGNGNLLKEKRLDKQITVFDLTRRGKFNYLSLYHLVKIIKTKRIDIVHTHLVHSGILGKIAARFARVRYVVTTRHYGYEKKENTLLYRLEERLTSSASVVIAISNAVKRYLITRNVVPEEKVIVINNAIDLETFNPNRVVGSFKNDCNNVIIGSVGRLHPQKGFPVLLESFRLVSEQLPNAILEIVGDGELWKKLHDQSEKLNIADKVHFLGRIPHQEIAQKLSQWDLFVLSSEWEGFGIAIIEAMAMEKAVVATKVEGIVEIVEDGITGYLVPPKSSTVLAAKIVELLSDEAKRLGMGRAGREKVLKHFSIDKFIKETKKVYDFLVTS